MGKKAAAKKTEEMASLEDIKAYIAGLRKEKLPIDVRHFIRVDMIIDAPNIPDKTIGWVHTHGMWEVFGLPELEIRGVRPDFMMISAGQMLNHVAQYMVDGQTGKDGAKPVKAGQVMSLGIVHLRFEEPGPLNPDDKAECETHFQHPRLNLVNAHKHQCKHCEDGTPHDGH